MRKLSTSSSPYRVLGGALLAVAALTLIAAATGSARTLCASSDGNGCSLTLREAVAAARPGDTIKLGADTFSGGIHIDKSIRLVGAGRLSTDIFGGGPVITIGRFMGSHPPKVTIEKLEISDGETHGNGVEAFGGGVYIPPAKGYRPGAKVTMREVAVNQNTAAPTRSRGPGPGQRKEWPRCPGGPCRFAIALGGGIDSWGSLTIEHSEVSQNVAGGRRASDADGGGIASSLGTLRIVNSEIDQNTAAATWSKSRFAEGGGVFVNSGALRIVGSELLQNTANLKSKLGARAGKSLVEMNANSGGVHAGDGVPTKIVSSSFLQNGVDATDLAGAPSAFDSAMLMGDAPVEMKSVGFEQNELFTTARESGEGPSGSVLEVDGGGTLEHIVIEENGSHARSTQGSAEVSAALAVFNFTEDARPTVVRDSTIIENRSFAKSPGGVAKVLGAGVLNDSLLTLEGVTVAENRARAEADGGFAEGGGIWNGRDVSGPPVKLDVRASTIKSNGVTGTPAIQLAGGGVFSAAPLSLSNPTVIKNRPEDCVGTGCP